MTLADFRLIVPPHTPFHADGSVNLPAVEKQAALFVENPERADFTDEVQIEFVFDQLRHLSG